MRYLGGMVLLLAVALRVGASESPTPFVAVYDLSQGSLALGTMERRFDLKADGAYTFLSRMRTTGALSLVRGDKITETSSGQLRDGRFIPDSYSYSNSHGDKHFVLRFDYSTGQVTRADQAKGVSMSMPAAVLDKLVYQMQMMLDLAGQPQALHYNIADKNKLKEFQFANRGREAVSTEAGNYQTIRLELSASGDDRRTVVWCAQELAWLPVKVEYHDKDGGVTTAALHSLNTP